MTSNSIPPPPPTSVGGLTGYFNFKPKNQFQQANLTGAQNLTLCPLLSVQCWRALHF